MGRKRLTWIACILIALTVEVFTFEIHPHRTAWTSTSARAHRRANLPAVSGANKARIAQAYGALPLSFEANLGQSDGRVKFVSRGGGYSLFLTADEAVLALGKSSVGKVRAESVLRMKLLHARPASQIVGIDRLPGKSNYFIGNEPLKWRADVPNYAKVKYQGVYPGVDLVYYGNQNELEYDFVVAPGAEPDAIGLGFQGARSLHIDEATGDVVLNVDGAEVRIRKPTVYQVTDTKRYVEGHYVVKTDNSIAFEIPRYDGAKPLVIDPSLSYSTYLGGSLNDLSQGIAVDSEGNAYVTGSTNSLDFPVSASPYQPAKAGPTNVFVTKLGPTGSTMIYSTYLGGSGTGNAGDVAWGIAIDSEGNAYVTGQTNSTDFPTHNPIQSSSGGASDAFVTKLDPTGSSLVYSTYLGGTGADIAYGIALDSGGNAYVAGFTNSGDFPTMNPLQGYNGGGDGFITKVKFDGSAWEYSTYLGGSGADAANSIAVDSLGNAYVTGSTSSADFPILAPFQASLRGTQNAFVTKLNAAGSAKIYSTYLGGGSDAGNSIGIDSFGNAYVTGVTSSNNFPTMNASQAVYGDGASDAFVTKLNTAGSALIYSTYLGGSQKDIGWGIEVDSIGNAYVGGQTNSPDFPTKGSIQKFGGGNGTCSGVASAAPCADAFVSWYSPSGFVLYATYLGGSDDDKARGIAVDSFGNAYVSGPTFSTNFPTVNPLPSSSGVNMGANGDAFVAKILFPSLFGLFQQVPGLLTQVAVGANGAVWGINASDQIFRYDTQTQSWDLIPGLLTQIAVGADGSVWGINASNQIFRYDTQTESWDLIPGLLSQIAVGFGGAVWGINSAHQIYRFNPGTQNWDRMPGALAQIAGGPDGSVWGLNASSQIFRFNALTQNWDQIPGGPTQLAVGFAGTVWGLDSSQHIYRFNLTKQNWDLIPGLLTHIGVGADGAVWGINATNQIFQFNASTQGWNLIPGPALATISVGVGGAVWGIDKTNNIYQFAEQTGPPPKTYHQQLGLLSTVAVGPDGNVWGINAASQTFAFNSGTQSWILVPGLVKQIAVGFGGAVWAIGASGQVFRFNPATQTWATIPGSLTQIAVGSSQSVWGLNAAHQIFHFNTQTQSWNLMPGLLAQIAVAADGTVWGINSAQQIFRFDPATHNWDLIPGLLTQVAVGSSQYVWGINAAQQIFRFDTQTQNWIPVPGLLAQMGVGIDGAVWGLNAAGQIFWFNTQIESFNQIPGLLAQIKVGAGVAVWGFNSANQIFRFY